MSSPPSYKSYDSEFDRPVTPELAAEIAAYESGPRHEHSSNQALEELARLFEMNVNSRKQYRFSHQDEFKSQREGRILHMNDFLGRLRRAGVTAWYTDKGGRPGMLGLFVKHAGLYSGCTHEAGSPHYVAFAQVPYMQEYEEMYFDRYDVPLGTKRRGWRTLLLRLIEQKILTEALANEFFGPPDTGPVSRRYRETIQYLRGLGNGR